MTNEECALLVRHAVLEGWESLGHDIASSLADFGFPLPVVSLNNDEVVQTSGEGLNNEIKGSDDKPCHLTPTRAEALKEHVRSGHRRIAADRVEDLKEWLGSKGLCHFASTASKCCSRSYLWATANWQGHRYMLVFGLRLKGAALLLILARGSAARTASEAVVAMTKMMHEMEGCDLVELP